MLQRRFARNAAPDGPVTGRPAHGSEFGSWAPTHAGHTDAGAWHRVLQVVMSPSSTTSRAAGYAVAVIVGVLATAIGLAFLRHPVAGWAFGIARSSDAPPVFGICFLVVPVVLVGVALRRIWEALSLDVEISRKRHERKQRQPTD